MAVYLPFLAVIFILMAFSAFFSCGEAAFFSLTQEDRNRLSSEGTLSQLCLQLLHKSNYLLNSILFGNLMVNLLTFTLSTVVAFQLQRNHHPQLAGMLALFSLFGVIVFCEVLPKNLGVMFPRFFAKTTALPLSFIVHFLKPMLPLLEWVNILSQREVCPNFTAEPYLQVSDLERAVEKSGNDAALLKREQRVLQNLVSLSDICAEELMRPRSMIKVFHPPLTFDDLLATLHGKLPRSGYCLLTESDSDEVAAALSLTHLSATALESDWERQFKPIVYVPWSASLAEVFERLHQKQCGVAVVVNEFGETAGILTLEDIIETVFTREQGRSRRLLNQMEIKKLDKNRWQLNGLTSLRRLQRKFNVSFDNYSSITVGGLLREILERFPRKGDRCSVGTMEFFVVELSGENEIIIEMRCNPNDQQSKQ
jgi:CBS domain containing-hemolysin-like protein